MLTPGILAISPRVLKVSTSFQINHRHHLMEGLISEIKNNIKKVLKLSNKYELVLFTSTGRGAVEASVSSIANQRILILENGRWSKHMANIAKKYNKKVLISKFSEERPLPLDKVEEKIKKLKPKFVCFVAHDTERGLRNPVEEIIRIAKKYKCGVLVDAMSSVVVDDIDYDKLGADLIAFSSGKGLRSLHGMGIVAVRKSSVSKIDYSNNHYFDLKTAYEKESKGIFARNQIIPQVALALNEATKEILKEGVKNRRKDIKKKMDYLKKWAKSKNLKFGIREEYIGDFSLPLYLPKGWTYKKFVKELDKKGFFIFYGYEGPNGRVFEISPVGYMTMKDVKDFTRAVESVLKI